MRYVVSFLLVTSGVLAVLADWQRWHPACVGGFDSDTCVERQSDWYDYAPPGESWIPIGTSAPLMATSYVLMALAVLGLFRTARAGWWTWVVGAVFALSFGLVAAEIFASASTGSAVSLPATVVTWPVLAGLWPCALLVLGATGLDRPGPAWPLVVVAACLALASPLALYFTAAIVANYMSHDTSPWTQAIGGVLTVVAGFALLRARPVGAAEREPALVH
ncbi:hypothetical protein SAMN05216184_11751 [Georgenia satyanarayanai]|uniref:DUF998 domain-containing protein n=1 Tax=Georgenia satyanarayanai TaxID=860221 RepID=A0A2Y9AWA5_9MICO|nr:hypothetical protein [Georgenia satyanarayanai]PYF96833.1 hypothetical protein A8987_11751 [Georgenia satyanarayanai]SSA46429.1 hypothetical protein SAMN05216184_11751 [Georgenia satyanarayanai]